MLLLDILAVGIGILCLLPVCHGHVVHYDLRTVVHGLGHIGGGSINIFTQCEDTLQGEVRDYVGGHLEADFQTHVPLVDAGDGKVGECVLEVIVCAHHLALILDGGVVQGTAEVDTVCAVLVVHIGREGLGGGESFHERVSGTGAQESLVELGGIGKVTYICIYPGASVEDVVQAQLCGIGNEVAHLGLAVGCGHGFAVGFIGRLDCYAVHDELVAVFVNSGEETLSDETVPPEGVVADSAADVHLKVSKGVALIEPGLVVPHLGKIVVAVLVANAKSAGFAVGNIVVEVILEFVWRGREVPFGKVVDIQEILAAEKVCNLLVILSAVDACTEAAGNETVV